MHARSILICVAVTLVWTVSTRADFPVNTYTDDDQMWPDLAMSDDGNFVVVWESSGQDGSFRGTYGQRYNAAGEATSA